MVVLFMTAAHDRAGRGRAVHGRAVHGRAVHGRTFHGCNALCRAPHCARQVPFMVVPVVIVRFVALPRAGLGRPFHHRDCVTSRLCYYDRAFHGRVAHDLNALHRTAVQHARTRTLPLHHLAQAKGPRLPPGGPARQHRLHVPPDGTTETVHFIQSERG